MSTFEELQTIGKRLQTYIIPRAISTTMAGAADAATKEIRDVFTGPTAMITNSVKTMLEGTSGAVYISAKDYSVGPSRSEGEDVTPANILAPHIFGGGRISKNAEMLCRRRGVMRSSQYITPSKYVPKDGNGNVSGPTMIKILSAAGLLDGSGHRSNQTDKSRARNKTAMRGVYVVPFVGIFQHTAGTGKGNRRWASSYGGPGVPLLFFSSKPQYEAERFDFEYVVHSYFAKHFAENFNIAMGRAVGK